MQQSFGVAICFTDEGCFAQIGLGGGIEPVVRNRGASVCRVLVGEGFPAEFDGDLAIDALVVRLREGHEPIVADGLAVGQVLWCPGPLWRG
ncbi:hypothetical protein DEJ47_13365 [Streptomyces venezuelae]|uniref:Uncharacterized protein n=1 Tax=Streptomyces venezuelae TaxID=54571 RepID=A0A5P2B9Y4_STRVZ|nr:hypothetical protein DEJ47_13365 [Streptomyces venezuelae]